MSSGDAWFFIGLGLVLAAHFPFVLIMLVRTRARRRTWPRVTGTVTSVRTKRRNDGETRTTVHYRYTDATGQQRSGTDTPWFRAPGRKSDIAVVYDPDNPGRSEAASTTWLNVLFPITLVLLALGVWSLVAGIQSLAR
ncbi:DUF3592 domain-containing protein [Saccharopolyspora sp. TS4A08]|uniref:DUF3592 domain-containing protein n=1 Tax=Saccharopolyspora ipomoeae TaxID=3042027 RepID=A0ABT6PYA6_9PSEU|nr:DUF3592 domain-containing protein [Saccharopolyspora sp. TS4A08]MDI2032633.1 DUF3592 domain-containing protein [Saccharopolyspora sp. TS4A08]